jgi:dolichyl-phosphate beta-glucosyltransferase
MYLTLKKFIKYSIVGVSGTFIDVLVLFIFVDFFNMPILVSTVLAFTIAASNNFIFNKRWTFKNNDRDTIHQYIKFLLVSIVGLILTIFLMSLLTFVIGLWYIASKLITSGCVLLWNFIGNKNWTFKESFCVPQNNNKYDYSIIIPAYNEENRLEKTISEILGFIRTQNYKFEIIVIDDGSTDNTLKVVRGLSRGKKNFNILSVGKNRGKGHALRKGVAHSSGKYILITDADGATPIKEFLKLKKFVDQKDIIIGSRRLNKSVITNKTSRTRRVISSIGSNMTRSLVKDIKDTQCGFKLMHHKAAKHIFGLQKINRFGYDIEILALAQYFKYSLVEIPIEWKHVEGSKVRPVKDSFKTFMEIVFIHYNFVTKRY